MIKHLALAVSEASPPNDTVMKELAKVQVIASEITPILHNLIMRKDAGEREE